MYTSAVCEIRPHKTDPNRTPITISYNRIFHSGDMGINTALLEIVKLPINSVILHREACFTSVDIQNFYLSTPMDRPEYVQIKLSDIPQKLINKYNLH